MRVDWRGVYPAATTQFRADQSLDLPGTAAHLERLLRAGAHGVIMLGTVGENCSLEYAEKLDVLRAAVRQVAGPGPLLTRLAECSTAPALRSRAHPPHARGDGITVQPPV